MKYHIDTIPIWDAYHEETECPLCILKKKSEESYVDSFLGGSVMEPATRVEVNEKGFCAQHNSLLYKAQKRLSLALMTHTYTMETIKKMNKFSSKLRKSAVKSSTSSILNSFTFKSKDNDISEFVDWIKKTVNRCVICDRISQSLDRYAYTIIYMWDNEDNFKEAFKQSKGFCLPHMAHMLDMSSNQLKGNKLNDFIDDFFELQVENISRLEEEIKWFTLKFDYKNQDKPWGNSKDSLPRILQKLSGEYME